MTFKPTFASLAWLAALCITVPAFAASSPVVPVDGVAAFDVTSAEHPAPGSQAAYLERMRQAASARQAPGHPSPEALKALEQAAARAGSTDPEMLRTQIESDFNVVAPR